MYYILHILQIVPFKEFHFLVDVFNFTSLIKHFASVEFGIATLPADLN